LECHVLEILDAEETLAMKREEHEHPEKSYRERCCENQIRDPDVQISNHWTVLGSLEL
jgi:hypothetical protein